MKFIIYGATKGRGDGIGRAAALALTARQHTVRALCRDPEKARESADLPLEAIDILSTDGRAHLTELIREFDPDVIWSACGVGFGTPLWALSDDELAQMIEANVTNNAQFCRACAPSCVDGGPHLVLTGSAAGVLDAVGASMYSGVKGFLVPFLRGLRREFRQQGHNPKLSLLLLHSVRATGIDLVVDALEFVGRQSHSMEVLVA